MKNTVLLCILFLVLSSCTHELLVSETEKSDSPSNFVIKKTNSSNDFSSLVKSMVFKNSEKSWSIYHDKTTASISHEAFFEATLENGEKVEISFWFHHNNFPISKLNISSSMPAGIYGTKWEFKDFDKEAENFYKSDYNRIIVEKSNGIFAGKNLEEMKIFEVKKVNINGKDQIFLHFAFNGIARGFYDPQGLNFQVYEIENGSVKSVID